MLRDFLIKFDATEAQMVLTIRFSEQQTYTGTPYTVTTHD